MSQPTYNVPVAIILLLFHSFECQPLVVPFVIAHRHFFDDEELAGSEIGAVREDRGISIE